MKDKKTMPVLVVLSMVVALFAVAEEAKKEVDDSELGLSKTSVFATPDPIVPTSKAKSPGENQTMKRYFSGQPPAIPHQVEDYLPITIAENLCLDCHDLQEQIGKERGEGEPTPIPVSHYTDLRRNPNEIKKKLVGARFNCTQCHTPQTDSKLLVANTYRQ